MLRGVGVGWGGSKLALDINKNINNICLGCGCWATGHSSRVAMIWCQYIGSTHVPLYSVHLLSNTKNINIRYVLGGSKKHEK